MTNLFLTAALSVCTLTHIGNKPSGWLVKCDNGEGKKVYISKYPKHLRTAKSIAKEYLNAHRPHLVTVPELRREYHNER